MLTIDETFLQEATRRAIQEARDAIASDPANLLTQQVTQATTGEIVSLTLSFGLGVPTATTTLNTTSKPVPEPEPTTLTAADVRARAEEVGFVLNGRSLRSQSDKEAALLEIEEYALPKSSKAVDPPEIIEFDEEEEEEEDSQGGSDFPEVNLDDIVGGIG